MLRCAIALLLVAVASPAIAQNSEQLHALTATAAQQYGIPAVVLNDLIQGESGFNANVGCNSYGACGVAQFIPGTAKQYGVDVNDASSSIFGAAHYLSDLQAQKGSLTAALSSYSGGCTAAAPCNAAYGQAFQAAATADAGGTPVGNSASDGATLSSGSAAASPAVPDSSAILFRPFQWIWDHVTLQAQANITAQTAKAQNIAYLPYVPIVVIWGATQGIMFWAGKKDFGDAILGLVTLIIVGALVVPGSPLYAQWSAFAQGVPAYFSQQFGGMGNSGPAGVFDSVWQAFWVKVVNTWHNAPWEKVLLTGLLLVFVIGDVASMLTSMFATFLVATFAIFILLEGGPVFILGALFRGTYGFFRFWIDLIVALMSFLLILDIMLGFFATVLLQLIDATGSATTPYSDMLPNLLGGAMALTVLGIVNGYFALQFGKMRGTSHDVIGSGVAGAVIAARAIGRLI
jgi:hypothetical protein